MVTSIFKKLCVASLAVLLLAGCVSPVLEEAVPRTTTSSIPDLTAPVNNKTDEEGADPFLTLGDAGLGTLYPTPQDLTPPSHPPSYGAGKPAHPPSYGAGKPAHPRRIGRRKLPTSRHTRRAYPSHPFRLHPPRPASPTPPPFTMPPLKQARNLEPLLTPPSGSKVTATVNGKAYTLTQTGTTSGVGSFRGDYTVPTVNGTVDFGQVVYSMTYKGSTTQKVSEGHLFAVGPNDTLRVQIKSNSATAFRDPRTRVSGNYTATLKKGAVDGVTDYYGSMYRLATVGWIDASSAQPLTSAVSLENQVSGVSYTATSEGEVLTLAGTSNPPYKVSRTPDALTLTFYRTSGVSALPIEESALFSSAKVSSGDGALSLTFTESNPGQLWGYLVEYSGGTTQVLFVKKPKVVDPERPLTGMTIVVDPGHGGKDTGALGFGANGQGLVEKQINLATAAVLKAQLEANGATVVMTRDGDGTVELSERLDMAQQTRADFMISLHCNSSSNTNGQGVEVYYYDANSRSLASNISSTVSSQTQRTNRGAKHSCYVVTLSSHAPSVLVEMGFLTNQAEYNGLQDQNNIEQTAKAITASIIAEVK